MTYADKLSKMIRVPTISRANEEPGSAFDEFRVLLQELFPSFFQATVDLDLPGIFLRRWNGSDKGLEPLMLISHHDVVEVSGEWTYPCFCGEVHDGYLWGRGTLDNKTNLFAFLQAAEDLVKEGFTPKQDIYFFSPRNEETSGEDASIVSKYFQKRQIRFSMLLDEGGAIVEKPLAGCDGSYAMIGMGEKAVVDVAFIARSEGGHASTPEKNSPLVRLGAFMCQCDKKNLFSFYLEDVTKQMLCRLGKNMNKLYSFLFGNLWLTKPVIMAVMKSASASTRAMLCSTIAFTQAKGSDGANVIPQVASVNANIRASHHQGVLSTLETLKKLSAKYDLEMVVTEQGVESPISRTDTKAFEIIENATLKVLGVQAIPYIQTGASDSRWFSKVCDNVFRFIPLRINDKLMETIHSRNERVLVEDLDTAVEFYSYIIRGNYEK